MLVNKMILQFTMFLIIKIIWCIAELVILRENFEKLFHHEENMKRQKLYF